MAQPNNRKVVLSNPFASDADPSSGESSRSASMETPIPAEPAHELERVESIEEPAAIIQTAIPVQLKHKKKSVSFHNTSSAESSYIAPWSETGESSGQSPSGRKASIAMPPPTFRKTSSTPRFRPTLDTPTSMPSLNEDEQVDATDSTPAMKQRTLSADGTDAPASSGWGRRKSSAVAPNLGARRKSSIAPNFARRFSQFNPFDRNSGQTPTIENESDAAGTLGGDGVTSPPKAKLRSQSASARGGLFRNPFNAEGEEDTIPGQRRESSPMVRRPSQFQRMMSVVAEPNPIPPRYRSKSVSSLAYFVTPLESSNAKLPIFEDDIETQKENIQEYLAGVELLQAQMKRKPWQSHTWQGTYFFLVIAIVYFVFIGRPIWPGLATLYYRWLRTAHLSSLGVLIFVFWAFVQAFLPLCTRFEQEVDDPEKRDSSETALVIPAYKAANVLGETIEHALKIFKPEQIFIVNNGNSPEPMDNTADVCAKYGVNHAWVPIGSKIVAEFVGVALTTQYKYVMLIDDDVHLPANLPIVTNRIDSKTKCIGYTIKSTGENGSKGTIIQQCQDMEYKASGLTRTFAGKYGSATFPHGAIILWEREVLKDLFNVHPGYTISEDWYFGHAARSSGYRIQFCSQVFVETETPPAFIKSTSAARGGFGEMTVYKQRFGRWNYFFLFRIWEDTIYILFSWRLGFFRELITKIWVLVEVYDSVMGMLRPFVVVITAIAAWRLLLIMTGVMMSMYLVSFTIFNSYHLRRKNEMVSWKILPQFVLMKFVLLWVNTMSVYYGLFDYARFFKVRHERVIENKRALEAAYNVRLGQNLVPLDTHMGEAVQEVDPDAITSKEESDAVLDEKKGPLAP